MAQNNALPSQKIFQASGGNIYLQELLTQVSASTNLQQSVTNTQGKTLPPQAQASVALINGSYVVKITDPSAVGPASPLQAQQGGGAQPSQAVTAVYHQVRAAQDPRFSGATAQVFGGATGSIQNYYTLQLGSGSWFFQVRSSYDGMQFNTWQSANSGDALNVRPETVIVEPTGPLTFASFELPGQQRVTFGAGLVQDGGGFSLPDNLYSSAMAAIPSPNGFVDDAHVVHGLQNNQVSVPVPASTVGLIGPPDFPITVHNVYQDGEMNQWVGGANVFCMAFDPLGQNVQRVTTSSGTWAIFAMVGGWSLAIGSGQVASGAAIQFPAGFNAANMVAIASHTQYMETGNEAHGLTANVSTTGVVTATYADGSGHTWGGMANWFSVAYSPGVPVQNVSGGSWLVFALPGGRLAAIGAGIVPSGTSFGLPTVPAGQPGFTASQMLATSAPATFLDSGNPCHGVYLCDVQGATPVLEFTDGEGNRWTGNVQWMGFAYA